MALPNLVLYRRANAPAVRIVLEDINLTGSVVELDITPKTTGVALTFSTEGAGLTIAGTNTVIWTYSEDDAAALPIGDWTAFDLYRIIDSTREKIGAGTVRVNGVGGFEQQAPVYVEVPGIQGPAAYLPEGMWEPGPYVAKSVTTHSGSTWLALVDTEEEPGEGSDWQILLDGSGAAADREAAGNAAAIAVPAGEAAVSAAEIVVPLAAQVDANATAVETARAEVATNTTTVATNTAAAEAAKVAAEAAELAAQTAVANPSVAYDLLTTLNADLAHAAGTVGQVLADGTNNGFYVKVGASGTGSWSKKSDATVPALDVRTDEIVPEGDGIAITNAVGQRIGHITPEAFEAGGISANRSDNNAVQVVDPLGIVVAKIDGDVISTGGARITGSGVELSEGSVLDSLDVLSVANQLGQIISSTDIDLSTPPICDSPYIGNVPAVITQDTTDPTYNTGYYQMIPGICRVGTKLFVAFFRNNTTTSGNGEEPGMFLVMCVKDLVDETPWEEMFYIVPVDLTKRVWNVALCEIGGRLAIIYTYSGNDVLYDGYPATWCVFIENPEAKKGLYRFSPHYFLTYGLVYNGFRVNGKEFFTTDYWLNDENTPVTALAGRRVGHIELNNRGEPLWHWDAALPLEASRSEWIFGEPSVTQEADGLTWVVSLRSITSVKRATSPDRGLTWSEPANWAPVTPFLANTKHFRGYTPSGRQILVYNAAATRSNPTIVLLNPDGTAASSPALIASGPATYFVATYGADQYGRYDGKIYISYDNPRGPRSSTIDPKIMLAIVDEDSLETTPIITVETVSSLGVLP